MRRRTKWLLALGLPVLLLGGGFGAAVALGPAALRPLVQARASAAIGRPVTIGALHMSPGRVASITADDVVIANPPGWSDKDPPLARIRRLTIRLDLWAYLRHRQIVIPSINLGDPDLFVAETPAHQANYRLTVTSSGGTGPEIGALTITGGKIHAVLAPLRADFQVAVETRQPTGQPATLLAEARGTYAGQPITARMEGGAALALRDTTQPWPVDLRLAEGATEMRLRGTIDQPLTLSGAKLELRLAGPSLSGLRPLIGIALPETPPYQLAGAIDLADHGIRFHDIAGRVGASDLEGTIAVTPAEPRPVVQAELFSRAVRLADLGGLVGGTPPGKPSPPSPGLLPATPLSIPQFSYADVHLRYRARQIEGRSMPLDNLEAALDIVDGRVALHPLRFGVGAGRIDANIDLAPLQHGVRAAAEIDFQSLDLARLMAATRAFQGTGALSGSARIRGDGDLLAAIAAVGNGEIVLGMVGGDLSAVLVDLSGLEFGNAVLSGIGLPKRTRIECLVADFALDRGILRSRALILDTGEAIVQGAGSVNMRDEAMRFTIRTLPKHFTIGSVPGPIDISGTLKHPAVLPSAQTVARAGAAGALGVLLAPLALLPTIQFGTADHHRCEALLMQARRKAPGTPPAAHNAAAAR